MVLLITHSFSCGSDGSGSFLTKQRCVVILVYRKHISAVRVFQFFHDYFNFAVAKLQQIFEICKYYDKKKRA